MVTERDGNNSMISSTGNRIVDEMLTLNENITKLNNNIIILNSKIDIVIANTTPKVVV